jgi:hypothetical protein
MSKRKTNKNINNANSLAALTMTYGAKIISSSRNDQEGLDKLLALCL